jgi:hypothetical protein
MKRLNTHGYFWEYAYVTRHTRNLELLKDLAAIRLDEDEVRFLVEELCVEHGLSKPKLRFNNRTDRGWYSYSGFIRLNPTPLAETMVHELAHHWVYTKLRDVPSDHGWDFTLRLDKLAESASTLIDELPS